METAVGVLPAAVCAKKEGTDSPGCGRATAVAAVHWTAAKSRLSNPSAKQKSRHQKMSALLWWGRTDSLRCGEATAVAAVHWTAAKGRLSNLATATEIQKRPIQLDWSFMVGEDGFEPSKRNAADLQSVPFGHSGTPPYSFGSIGAGRRTRDTEVTTSF